MTAWARWESGCGTTAARHLRWRWPCSSAAQPCSTALRHIKSAWQVLWLPGSSTSLRNIFFPAATERPCCCDYGFGSVCCVGVDGVVGGPSADSGAEPTLNDRERGRYVLAGTGTILRGAVFMHSHVLFLGLVSLAVLAVAGWIFRSRVLRYKVSVRDSELRTSSHRAPRPKRAKKVEGTASEPPPPQVTARPSPQSQTPRALPQGEKVQFT